MTRLARIAMIAVVATVSGCSIVGAPKSEKARLVEPSASSAPPLSCTYHKGSGGEVPRKISAPVIDPAVDGKPMIAEIVTNLGRIVMRLDGRKAPCTVASFRHLAAEHFYDNSPCHRLTTEGLWVLQCGDPTGTGRGGPGYRFGEENLPGGEQPRYPKGTVGMANAGSGTNGSQFFINYRDNTLPADYTIFGVVTVGLDVVEEVAAAGVRDKNGPGDGEPKLGISIRSVTVRPAS